MFGSPEVLLIPVVAALVGWGTNVIAVKMTFGPKEFIGFGRFGWQGIIPAKSPKMAAKASDLLIGDVIRPQELFARLDGKSVADELKPVLSELSRRIVNDTLQSEYPIIWRVLSKRSQEKVYEEVEKGFPDAITAMLADVHQNLNDLLDLNAMMVRSMTEDREMMVRIFKQCGHEEFKFIERSGLYFGFLFGIVQMILWEYFNFWWLLPLGGLIVGYLTNWLALQLIFRPIKPIKIGPWSIQGLFLKRQKEVAHEYSTILAKEVLTSEKIVAFVLEGPAGNALATLIQNRINGLIDDSVGSIGITFLRVTGNSARYERMKHSASNTFMEELPTAIRPHFLYSDELLEIRATLNEELARLSPQKFEGVLRPAFQEDEMTLIVVGAVLGLLAGTLQLLLLDVF